MHTKKDISRKTMKTLSTQSSTEHQSKSLQAIFSRSVYLLVLPSYLTHVLQYLGAPSMSYVLATTTVADEKMVCSDVLHKGRPPATQAFPPAGDPSRWLCNTLNR